MHGEPDTLAFSGLRRVQAGRRPDQSEVVALQNLIGNAALARLIGRQGRAAAPVQAKLLVGRADDPLEREADRIADQVMRAPSGQHPNDGGGDGEASVRRSSLPQTLSLASLVTDLGREAQLGQQVVDLIGAGSY